MSTRVAVWAISALVAVTFSPISPTCLAAQNLYRVQRYRTLVNVYGFKPKAGDTTVSVAPKHSHFIILDKREDRYVVRFTKVASLNGPALTAVDGTAAVLNLTGASTVRTDVDYEVPKAVLVEYDYEFWAGLEPGAMVVPVKWQHNGTLTAGSSLGLSAGFHSRYLVIPTSLVASAGLTVVPTADVNSGESETKTGFTYALGLVTDVFDVFQIGFVVGKDHLGGSSGKNYEFEDKLWKSFSIGFSFTK